MISLSLLIENATWMTVCLHPSPLTQTCINISPKCQDQGTRCIFYRCKAQPCSPCSRAFTHTLKPHGGLRRARPRSLFNVKLFNGNLESFIQVLPQASPPSPGLGAHLCRRDPDLSSLPGLCLVLLPGCLGALTAALALLC